MDTLSPNLTTGQRIRELRRSLEMTQEAFAERAHLRQSHLCLMENGKRKPSLMTLKRLAKEFAVPITDLLD